MAQNLVALYALQATACDEMASRPQCSIDTTFNGKMLIFNPPTAQRPEVRSYDLFGVRLDFVDRNHQMYRLHVPGLRENAPKVAYGKQFSNSCFRDTDSYPTKLSSR